MTDTDKHTANKRGAGNGAVALSLHVGSPGRAVPDHGRSPNIRSMLRATTKGT